MVIGRVVVGMEVVRMMERVEVDAEDKPLQDVAVDDCGASTGEIPHRAVPLSPPRQPMSQGARFSTS